jgi:hypothetical protein
MAVEIMGVAAAIEVQQAPSRHGASSATKARNAAARSGHGAPGVGLLTSVLPRPATT